MPPYLLDPWTAVHFLGWGVGAAVAVRRWNRPAAVLVLGLLVGAGWELLEPLTAEAWWHFREPVYNRWGTDLLADGLGAWAGTTFRRRRKRGLKSFNVDNRRKRR